MRRNQIPYLILDPQPKVLRLGADAVDGGAPVGSEAWLAKQNQELQRQLAETRVLLDTERAKLERARAGSLPSLTGPGADEKILAPPPATWLTPTTFFLFSCVPLDLCTWFRLFVNMVVTIFSVLDIKQVEKESDDVAQAMAGMHQKPLAETNPAPENTTPANHPAPENTSPAPEKAPEKTDPPPPVDKSSGSLGVEVVPPDPTPAPAPSRAESEIEQLVLAQLKSPAATTAPVNEGGGEKVNWATHKKEGMRLTRFVESNAAQYPHMAQMFDGGNKKDRVGYFVSVCFNLSGRLNSFLIDDFCNTFAW